jgi:hypothetical protein|nr:MAG TPA: Baseplate component [Caudoviricetes sp.]
MITEYLETSVLSNVLPQKLVVVQNDSGRNVNVNIVDYKIPAEAAARIWVIKPDGKVVWNNCDIITDQIVKVKLTNQMLAVVGLSKAKIEIYTEDEVLSTFNFYLQVEEDISDPNGTESKNESTALEEIANKIKDYEITVEKGLTSIENKIAEVVDTADGKMRDIDTLTSAKLTDINNTAVSQIKAINSSAAAAGESQREGINTVASSQISNITNITNQQLENINAAATRQIEMIENKTAIQINAINNTALTQIASINNTAISQIENMTVKYSDMCRTLGVEHEGILCIRNLKRVSINVASFKYIKFGKMYIAPTDKKLISTQGSYLFNVDNFGYINTAEEYDISSEKELYCQSEYYHDPTIIVYVEYKLYNESEETTTE